MRVRYKGLSLQHIRSFRDVCELGSYAEAARHQHRSTSALWEQLRGLERHIGAPLLENDQGVLRPTPDGMRLLEYAVPHLNGLESTREVLQQLREQPPERLTIASGMRMLMEEVGDGVRAFRHDFPSVAVRLLYASAGDVTLLIERGEADLGIVLDPAPHDSRSAAVVHEPAYSLDYVLVTPADHPLLRRRGLRLSDLVKYPLVVGLPEQASRIRTDAIFQAHALANRMHISVETNSAALTISSVRAGLGVGITAGHVKTMLSQDLGVRSLTQWFGTASYSFVWSKGAHVPPVQRRLAEDIRNHAQSPEV